MPTVPTYDNFQTAPTEGGASRLSLPISPDIAGQTAANTGQALMRTGGALGAMAVDAQAQVNQARVNDAQNQLREAILRNTYDPQVGYLSLKGRAALDPDPNGQSMPDRYMAGLRDTVSQISNALGNDAQRHAFMQQAQPMLMGFQGDVERHMLGEFRNYNASVQDGTINLAGEQAMRAWTNPQVIGSSLDAIKAAVYRKGQLAGWSGSQIEAAQLEATSNVHKTVILSALTNGNPGYAQTYMAANKDGMTAEDLLRVQGQVNQSSWTQQAQGAVQSAQSDLVKKVEPNDLDRMVAITRGAESSNRDFDAQGNPIVSSAGAKYAMQVTPDTAQKPGYGIAPAVTDTPDEYNRVGVSKLQVMVQRYGGDPAKAWAAYNWGEANVDAAVAKAGPGGNWLALAPSDTQKYVQANVAALSNGGGSGRRPTALDFVNDAVSRLPPGASPQAVALTRTQAERTYALVTQDYAQKGEDAVRSAQQWIAQNEGGFDELPPSLRATVAQYAPDKLTALMSYAHSFETNDTQTDLQLYNRLVSHPDELAGMTDSQFEMLRNNLAPGDFKHFSDMRADLRSGQTSTAANSIDNTAFNQSLNLRLRSLDIQTAPKNADTSAQERLGAIQQFARNALFDAQAQAGKKFSPSEIDQFLNSLFTKSVTVPGMLWGTNTYTAMAMKYGDVPSADRDQLIQAFAAHGVPNPTHTDILNAYWRMKLSR